MSSIRASSIFSLLLIFFAFASLAMMTSDLPVEGYRPLAAGTCPSSITAIVGAVVPDIELSPWSGPTGTPVTVIGCGFDTTLDTGTCTISSTPGGLFTGTAPCTGSGSSQFGSFTVTAVAPGAYQVTLKGVTAGDSASAIFQVSVLSITTSTSTSTTTSVVSTSYSTLTTTTSFFSTLTTTTVASTLRSTETDNFFSYLTFTAATSEFSTISTTVTATTTALATTLTTSTVYGTTVTTVTGFIARVAQLLTGSPGSVLGILALFLLVGPMIARRFFE